MSKKSSSKGLSAKRVKGLVQASDWFLDSDLMTRLPADIYVNAIYSRPDGHTLVVLKDGAGRLYNSQEDWLSHLASLEHLQHQEAVHILQERLPQGQDFVRSIPSLVEQLSRKLHMPIERLDKSRVSLELVDQVIRQKERDECLSPEVFPPLVAYVGEVVRSSTNLDWEMRLASNGATWEPWLVSPNQSFSIASMIYDELSEEPNYSVSSVANVCL